jgi:hypothetical protein
MTSLLTRRNIRVGLVTLGVIVGLAVLIVGLTWDPPLQVAIRNVLVGEATR